MSHDSRKACTLPVHATLSSVQQHLQSEDHEVQAANACTDITQAAVQCMLVMSLQSLSSQRTRHVPLGWHCNQLVACRQTAAVVSDLPD